MPCWEIADQEASAREVDKRVEMNRLGDVGEGVRKGFDYRRRSYSAPWPAVSPHTACLAQVQSSPVPMWPNREGGVRSAVRQFGVLVQVQVQVQIAIRGWLTGCETLARSALELFVGHWWGG